MSFAKRTDQETQVGRQLAYLFMGHNCKQSVLCFRFFALSLAQFYARPECTTSPAHAYAKCRKPCYTSIIHPLPYLGRRTSLLRLRGKQTSFDLHKDMGTGRCLKQLQGPRGQFVTIKVSGLAFSILGKLGLDLSRRPFGKRAEEETRAKHAPNSLRR